VMFAVIKWNYAIFVMQFKLTNRTSPVFLWLFCCIFKFSLVTN